MIGNHTLAVAALAGTALLGLAASHADAQTIHIDFGSNTRQTSGNWNNMVMTGNHIHSPAVGVPLSLIDSNGNPTGISATVTNGFAFENTAGVGNGNATGDVASYPYEAYSDSWYINTGNPAVAIDPAGQITFSNLSVTTTYNFGIFASRMGTPIENRTTIYTANGLSNTLDAQDNTGTMVWINGIVPNGSGEIVLDVTKASGTEYIEGNNYGYIGFLEIQAVPEPASLGLLSVGALALLRRRKA